MPHNHPVIVSERDWTLEWKRAGQAGPSVMLLGVSAAVAQRMPGLVSPGAATRPGATDKVMGLGRAAWAGALALWHVGSR